jgi:hypothetical protein
VLVSLAHGSSILTSTALVLITKNSMANYRFQFPLSVGARCPERLGHHRNRLQPPIQFLAFPAALVHRAVFLGQPTAQNTLWPLVILLAGLVLLPLPIRN